MKGVLQEPHRETGEDQDEREKTSTRVEGLQSGNISPGGGTAGTCRQLVEQPRCNPLRCPMEGTLRGVPVKSPASVTLPVAFPVRHLRPPAC